MMKTTRLALFAPLMAAAAMSLPGVALAADPSCDCQQVAGACTASISVKPVDATTIGSYASELRFTSSAPACSKVNYSVDGTPYFNVLVNGNTGTDNIWGQKQISRANITDISCQVCKQVAMTPVPVEKKPDPELKPTLFDGQWFGAGNNSFGSAQRWTLNFATTAVGKAAITGTMEGSFPTIPIAASGTVSTVGGPAITWVDQQTTCSAKLLTDVSLAFECHGQGSVQIVMRRQ